MDVSPHTSGVCKYSCAKDGGGSLGNKGFYGLENFKEKLNVVGEVPLVFDVGDLFK